MKRIRQTRRGMIAGCTVAVAFAVVLMLADSAMALQWTIQTVDPDGAGGFIALDSGGVPHIAYTARTTSNQYVTMYASWTGSSWDKQPVATDTFADALALGNDGRPRVLYNAISYDTVNYASWNGQSWVKEVVATRDPNSGIWGRGLALDSVGTPHVVSYLNSFTQYSRKVGSQWLSEQVGPAGGLTGFCGTSIALDATDRPSIAGFQSGSNLYRYSRSDSGTWQGQPIATGGGAASLLFNHAGHPCIAHYLPNADILKYSYWNGTTWITQVVDNSGNVAGMVSLDLDSQDKPDILYAIHDENKVGRVYIQLAQWDGMQWNTERIDPDKGLNAYPQSLAIDLNDRVHVAYYADGELRYALGIPEPATLSLLALGGLALLRRKRASEGKR